MNACINSYNLCKMLAQTRVHLLFSYLIVSRCTFPSHLVSTSYVLRPLKIVALICLDYSSIVHLTKTFYHLPSKLACKHELKSVNVGLLCVAGGILTLM